MKNHLMIVEKEGGTCGEFKKKENRQKSRNSLKVDEKSFLRKLFNSFYIYDLTDKILLPHPQISPKIYFSYFRFFKNRKRGEKNEKVCWELMMRKFSRN